MLHVRAYIAPSPIHGYGCFAGEFIAKGQVVWQLDEPLDVWVPEETLPSLPAPVQAFLDAYGYLTVRNGQRGVILCGDHAKHMNHSDTPNLAEGEGPGYTNVAARDILPGEELTTDYYEFDLDADHKLGR
jgi:SET domain-containing protein